MTKYFVVYRGLGILVREIEAESRDDAAEFAFNTYDMDHNDGDCVYVVPASMVTAFPIERPPAKIKE